MAKDITLDYTRINDDIKQSRATFYRGRAGLLKFGVITAISKTNPGKYRLSPDWFHFAMEKRAKKRIYRRRKNENNFDE